MTPIIKDDIEYYKSTLDNFYVSKCGKLIKELKSGKYKHVHLGLNKCGYYEFSGGSQKIGKKLVHRIMGETFLENPENLRNIDHKNQIKTDNNLDNLRWFSQRDNMLNQTAKGISFSKDKNCWLCKDALKIIGKFETEKEAIACKIGYLIALGIQSPK